MRKLFLSIGVCLIVSMSGCAAAGSGSCGTSDFSLFQSSAPRNQPFRDCIRNWFRGDECNTCNAPAGLPTTCDSNVSPLCNQHGTQFSQAQPIYSSAPVQQPIGQGVQLYSDPNLNIGIPTAATPDLSSNLIDPAFGEGNLGIPTGAIQTGPIETGYGSIPSAPADAVYGGIPSSIPSLAPVEPGYGELPIGPSF